MTLKTLNIRFFIITFAALFSAAVTLKLGFWQLSRAHEKLSLEASIQAQAALPPLDASILVSPKASGVLHRTVALTGQWLPQHTLFLDNRQMGDKVGFFVVTPFIFTNTATQKKQTILVQRGWMPRNFLDRSKLPDIFSEVGETSIKGRIALSPSKLFEFKGAQNGVIRQNVDIESLEKEFKIQLLPFSLLQLDSDIAVSDDQKNQNQPLRHWPKANYGAEKNYGYMVQWWSLSGLIVLLYVWFQLVRPRIKKRTNKNTI